MIEIKVGIINSAGITAPEIKLIKRGALQLYKAAELP